MSDSRLRPRLLRDRLVLGEVLGVPGEALAERPPVDAEAARDVFLADVPLARLQELHDGDLPVRGRPRASRRRTRRSTCPCRRRCSRHDRARRVRALGKMVLVGWFDRGHERLGRTFAGCEDHGSARRG